MQYSIFHRSRKATCRVPRTCFARSPPTLERHCFRRWDWRRLRHSRHRSLPTWNCCRLARHSWIYCHPMLVDPPRRSPRLTQSQASAESRRLPHSEGHSTLKLNIPRPSQEFPKQQGQGISSQFHSGSVWWLLGVSGLSSGRRSALCAWHLKNSQSSSRWTCPKSLKGCISISARLSRYCAVVLERSMKNAPMFSVHSQINTPIRCLSGLISA